MTYVLVTLDTGTSERRGVPFPNVNGKAAYAAAVERAGGTPLWVSPTSRPDVLASMIEVMDALVVTGGDFDIAPERYGLQRSEARLDALKPERTDFEWSLTRAALTRGLPILGVCGGMQLLNVLMGGTLLQHVDGHEQPTSPVAPAHSVELTDCELSRALQRTEIEVNTTHHQAIDRVGENLVAVGHAPDGVVEAITHAENPRIWGVQWHPELLDDEVCRWLYGRLVV